ncbi:uncharacterized protein LOC141598528 [Silene latifolia]|uniref:uncharacterized protein LOC141598528 n=1 Tax=Silene latifolia TaxID=37657 RepID=UPI003D76DE2F
MEYVCKLQLKDTLWECLEKPIPIGVDSSEDSDNSTNCSDSTGSPPRKRRRFRRLIDFKTPEDLENLKSVAADVFELKDYAEWFLSKSKTNETNADILDPENYAEWVNSTLGTEDEAKVIIHPANYCTWYFYLVVQGIQPPRPRVGERKIESTAQRNKRYAEYALEHVNKTRNCSEGYEYTRECEILDLEDFVHLNFYARLKVSESGREPGPEELFFAAVPLEDTGVSCCCILDSKEFGNSVIRHPPGFECWECEYPDIVCSCASAYDFT